MFTFENCQGNYWSVLAIFFRMILVIYIVVILCECFSGTTVGMAEGGLGVFLLEDMHVQMSKVIYSLNEAKLRHNFIFRTPYC